MLQSLEYDSISVLVFLMNILMLEKAAYYLLQTKEANI